MMIQAILWSEASKSEDNCYCIGTPLEMVCNRLSLSTEKTLALMVGSRQL